MNESFAATFKRFTPAQKAATIAAFCVCVVPPFIVAVFNLPPAAWLNAQQGKMMNGEYFPKLTLVLLICGHILFLSVLLFAAAFIVKSLTGKTIAQLLVKKPVVEGPVSLTNIQYQSGDTHADACVRQEWIDTHKTVSLSFPDGSQFQIKLTPPISAGSQLRLKGIIGTGALCLTIQVSE